MLFLLIEILNIFYLLQLQSKKNKQSTKYFLRTSTHTFYAMSVSSLICMRSFSYNKGVGEIRVIKMKKRICSCSHHKRWDWHLHRKYRFLAAGNSGYYTYTLLAKWLHSTAQFFFTGYSVDSKNTRLQILVHCPIFPLIIK